MSKIKSAFICQQCAYESVKWVGQCPSCNTWNSFVEEVLHKEAKKISTWPTDVNSTFKSKPIKLQNVIATNESRLLTPDSELNRVLGGGIVQGSITLVAGEPGIGKSTLFLQVGLSLKIKVLYISGEESEHQIKLRAERLPFQPSEFYLFTETSIEAIFKEIKKLEPQLIIVDSIQTLYTSYIDSSAGTVSQIRECAGSFQRYAKQTNTPVFLIGHITKDGNIAGPKILEHMVDTVLQFEGDRHYTYRLLRTQKNRFGSTSELGIYEMTQHGLRGVDNPSEILITQREELLSGITVCSTIEGLRPLFIEVQALVTQSVYGTPQRTANGLDSRRLQLLLAILEKRGGFLLGVKDVFVNITGGIKVEDPSIDLAVLMALLSSYEDRPISQKICFAGEVGLSGEIRAVTKIEHRIAEAEKLGFEKIVVSKYNPAIQNKKDKLHKYIEVLTAAKIEEVYQHLF